MGLDRKELENSSCHWQRNFLSATLHHPWEEIQLVAVFRNVLCKLHLKGSSVLHTSFEERTLKTGSETSVEEARSSHKRYTEREYLSPTFQPVPSCGPSLCLALPSSPLSP